MRLFASGLPSSCVAGQVFGVSAGAQYCSRGSWVNDPTYGGAITLSTTDPAVGSQAWQYGPNDAGAHTFSYQPKTVSSQTVTAADNLGTSPASMSTVVQPGPLNHVLIDQPMKSPVMTGDTVSVCFNSKRRSRPDARQLDRRDAIRRVQQHDDQLAYVQGGDRRSTGDRA
jgi:hypothetical protein